MQRVRGRLQGKLRQAQAECTGQPRTLALDLRVDRDKAIARHRADQREDLLDIVRVECRRVANVKDGQLADHLQRILQKRLDKVPLLLLRQADGEQRSRLNRLVALVDAPDAQRPRGQPPLYDWQSTEYRPGREFSSLFESTALESTKHQRGPGKKGQNRKDSCTKTDQGERQIVAAYRRHHRQRV